MSLRHRLSRHFAKSVFAGSLAAAAATGLVGAGLLPGAPAVAGATTQPGNVIGVYTGAANVAGVQADQSLLGHHINYVTEFLDPTSWSSMENIGWLTSAWSNKGYTMVWGVPMIPNTGGATLAAGAAGSYNGYFKTLAQNLVAQGQASSIIRPGWEFNGNWFPWKANGQAASFTQYYRNIVNTMRSVPGQHFRFVWNFNPGWTLSGGTAAYYPGNAYVDYIAADIYSYAPFNWNTLLTEPNGLNFLASFAAQHAKPIAIPEWGLQPSNQSGAGDQPAFINDM
ncbi:MAG: glycosyl hydrolase, partial [Actinomycetota bacterium]|nr:glycosyl hydrolase [Actinomycetota bacterium]